ncbi:MAG: zinc-binding dehydrogenase [Candidatus Bathyarchaeia archaeon]
MPMLGVTYPGNNQVLLKEFPIPKPGFQQVRVKEKAAGICGSDLHMMGWPGSPGAENRIQGHEPCGVIDELGPGCGFDLEVGQRILICHSVGCGRCYWCRQGHFELCEVPWPERKGWLSYSAFADYVLYPDRNLLPLPDWMSYEVGAYLACGAGTAYTSIKKVAPTNRDTVICIGLGPVGLAGVAWAKALGATVIGADLAPYRLNLARTVGADMVINAKEENLVERVMELTDRKGADAAIDYSASAAGRTAMLDCLGVRGRACYVGETGQVTVDPSRQILGKQLTITGFRVFGIPELMEMTELIKEKKVPIEKLVTHRFRLTEIKEAIETFRNGNTGKVCIVWD